MTENAVIPCEIRSRIDAELTSLECAHQIRIVLAVESGSRAWGFASPDSDYDVRFIYMRRARSYLSVLPSRDVIERPIDPTLDINGWDLRKSLQLMLRSNAVLIEWLCSPIRYRDQGIIPQQLADLACAGADLSLLAYHYDRQARRSACDILEQTNQVRYKTYCYALRSALALKWVREQRVPAPMDLRSLIAGLMLPKDVEQAIGDLVEEKAQATEHDTTARVPCLDRLLETILADQAVRPVWGDRSAFTERADAFFSSTILGEIQF